MLLSKDPSIVSNVALVLMYIMFFYNIELIKETPEYNITSKFAPKHTNRMTIGDLTPHSPVQSQMKIPGSPNARNIASAMRQQVCVV